MLLMRLKEDYTNHKYYIDWIDKGRCQLYSDTSNFATGSTLYQIQNEFIAYVSRRLLEVLHSYSFNL